MPGSSKIVATGRVTAVNRDVGTLAIGGLVVDYSAVELTEAPGVGDVVAISGVQPVRGGSVLAEAIAIR